MEPRGGLLTLAGTVEPGIFACATRPRKLVKDSRLGAGVSAAPGVAPDFPRVCAGAARCLYPDFRGSARSVGGRELSGGGGVGCRGSLISG